MPTGGRGRTGGRRNGVRPVVAVLRAGVCHASPPRAPRGLSRRGRALFRELWRSPQSVMWDPVRDADPVGRLAELRADMESGRRAAWRHQQASALERRLLLTPDAMRLAGVRLATTAADGAAPDGAVTGDANEDGADGGVALWLRPGDVVESGDGQSIEVGSGTGVEGMVWGFRGRPVDAATFAYARRQWLWAYGSAEDRTRARGELGIVTRTPGRPGPSVAH